MQAPLALPFAEREGYMETLAGWRSGSDALI